MNPSIPFHLSSEREIDVARPLFDCNITCTLTIIITALYIPSPANVRSFEKDGNTAVNSADFAQARGVFFFFFFFFQGNDDGYVYNMLYIVYSIYSA